MIEHTKFYDSMKEFNINLLGFPYKITFAKNMFDQFGVIGCTGLYEGEMKLEPNISKADICATIIHECIETMVRKQEIKLDHTIITQLEIMLFGLIAHNPKFIRFLVDEIEKETKKRSSTDIGEEAAKTMVKGSKNKSWRKV